jgi:hypothetical protein
MPFGLVVLLLAVLVVPFGARAEEATPPVPANGECAVPADPRWTPAEKFVWLHACVGEEANFNVGPDYGGDLEPMRPEGLPTSRILTSAFLEERSRRRGIPYSRSPPGQDSPAEEQGFEPLVPRGRDNAFLETCPRLTWGISPSATAANASREGPAFRIPVPPVASLSRQVDLVSLVSRVARGRSCKPSRSLRLAS